MPTPGPRYCRYCFGPLPPKKKRFCCPEHAAASRRYDPKPLGRPDPMRRQRA